MQNIAMFKDYKFDFKIIARLIVALMISMAIHATLIVTLSKTNKLTVNNGYKGGHSKIIHVLINRGHEDIKPSPPPSQKSSKTTRIISKPEVLVEAPPVLLLPNTQAQEANSENIPAQKQDEPEVIHGIAAPMSVPFAGFGGAPWANRSRSTPPQGNKIDGQLQAMRAEKRQRMNSAMNNLYGILHQNNIEIICELKISENSQIGSLTCDPEDREGMVKSILSSSGIVWDDSAKDNYKECLMINMGTIKSEKLNCQKEP